eukprot:TRINITY_DN4149_c0_g1_i1.p1 TRINITY_DN4149_c0_g1~~TRINITY_DN4149_c0_g1_i1.p1  ORF type:complete len:246 (-),score=40.55 TRINITY_DN4149_c0_g1_i1:33-725(-)
MLGQSSVGKTSIFTRATEPDDLPTAIPNTIGVGFGLKKWRGKRFAIWDTAGQEKFYCLVPMYSRDSNALVLVYDITDRSTLDCINVFLALTEHHCRDCFKVLVGNKADLVAQNPELREVEVDDAKEYACAISAVYLETSAVTNLNINAIFDITGSHFFPELSQNPSQQNSPNILSPQSSPSIRLSHSPSDTPTVKRRSRLFRKSQTQSLILRTSPLITQEEVEPVACDCF